MPNDRASPCFSNSPPNALGTAVRHVSIPRLSGHLGHIVYIRWTKSFRKRRSVETRLISHCRAVCLRRNSRWCVFWRVSRWRWFDCWSCLWKSGRIRGSQSIIKLTVPRVSFAHLANIHWCNPPWRLLRGGASAIPNIFILRTSFSCSVSKEWRAQIWANNDMQSSPEIQHPRLCIVFEILPAFVWYFQHQVLGI